MGTDHKTELQPGTTGKCLPPARLLVLILMTCGFVVQMMLRVTMSVAIVAMVNSTAIPHIKTPRAVTCSGNISATSAAPGNVTVGGGGNAEGESVEDTEEGEYAWDEFTQGLVLSSFYWAYLVTQIPGGFLAERFGVKIVLGVSQGLNGLLALLIPTAASLGAPWVMAVRCLQGLVCGPMYPTLFPATARWFPVGERQRVVGIVNGITAFGILAGSAGSGLLASTLGWRAIFYVAGALALTWAALWMAFVHASPSDHPTITEEERKKIGAGNVSKHRTKKRPPYLRMISSLPVLAIVISETANSWALTYLMTSLPTYMKHVLEYDIKSNGVLSGLPLLCRGVSFLALGALADMILKKRWLSTTAIRRVSSALMNGGCGLLLLLVTFVGCQPAVATFFIAMAGLLNGLIGTGHLVNPLDIAPNYSASVFAIANTVGNGISTLSPIATGAIIQGNQSAERWNIVFYLGSGIFFTSMVLYQLLMSASRQPWDRQEDDDDKSEHTAEGEQVSNL